MKKLLHTIWGLGGGGVLATSSWFIYDAADPTLIRVYRDAWSPIQLTIKKSLTSATETPYSGSSCFQRFFGKIEIQNFNKTPPTGSTSSETKKFESLFKDTNSDIYGCAAGEGSSFYELVMMNDKVGFATWYDNNQRSFVLEKVSGGNTWEIKEGVWATGTPPNNIEQIKNKTGNWSWWFFITKDQTSANMKDWDKVFQSPSAVYEKDKGWKSDSAYNGGKGKIPDFSKVTTLDDFCQEQSYVRKSREQATNKEKLNVYCLVKSS